MQGASPEQRTRRNRLVILYGVGGLSDVGRHAVQVAHDLLHKAAAAAPAAAPAGQRSGEERASPSPLEVSEIVVITKHPDLLFRENWNCGCPEPHRLDMAKFSGPGNRPGQDSGGPSSAADPRLRIVRVRDWRDPELREHFGGGGGGDDGSGSDTYTSVVSCVGNRQSIGHNDAAEAAEHLVLPAMQRNKVQRLVCITSVGVEEDWPALEFFCVGRVALSCMFRTVSRGAFRDLTKMERLVRAAPLDYLLVRPVGIGEDVEPAGKWQVQDRKGGDELGFNMAKLDVARFMVREALRPELHKTAVVIGAVLDESKAQAWNEEEKVDGGK